MNPPSRPNRAAEIAAKAARLTASGTDTHVRNSSATPVSTGVAEEPTPQVTPPTAPAARPTGPAPAPPRTKPVRLSVDVPPADYAALVQMSVSLAGALGSTRVHHQEILRALLRLAITDPALADRVRDEIQERRRLLP